MNTLFSVIFFASCLIILFVNPDALLSSLLSGASGAASLSVALLSSYAIWLGIMQLWEECGITKKISRFLSKPIKKLFHLENEETIQAVSMNISANILGLGGAATPYGIKAAKLMEKEKNPYYSSSMLFVINATSLQLIPTSVISLRSALGSKAPAYIILPTLITSILSFSISTLLLQIILKKKNKKRKTHDYLYSSSIKQKGSTI